jgi:hypothetical protein
MPRRRKIRGVSDAEAMGLALAADLRVRAGPGFFDA